MMTKFVLKDYQTEAVQMLRIGLPIVIGQMGFIAMGVADMIQVGMMPDKGVVSVAAAGVSVSLFFTVAVIGLVALGVVAPMISKAKAEGTSLEISALYRSVQRVALILGVVTFALTSIIAYFFDHFGQDPEVTVLAKPFAYIIAASVVPLFLFIAIRQLSDGFGRTRVAMFVTLSALLLNIILNYFLINGIWIFPRLELLGSGIATFISRSYMLFALWFAVRRNPEFAPYLKQKLSKQADLSRRILKIGLPAGLQGFFEVAVFAAAVVIIGWNGKFQQAAHMIAINMCSITYMMASGIAAAGGIRVGHFWGLRDRQLMRLSGNTALYLASGFMFLAAMLFFLLNKQLVGLYTTDPNVVPIAVELLIIGGIFQLSDGLQVTALGILRGIADVNVPTVITLFAYWGVGLPVGYLLGFTFDMKAAGVWLGLTAGLTASAVLLNMRFYRLIRRLRF